MIELIKSSKDGMDAKIKIMKKKWSSSNLAKFLGKSKDERLVKKIEELSFLSEEQAKAILDLRLQRLTGLERNIDVLHHINLIL